MTQVLKIGIESDPAVRMRKVRGRRIHDLRRMRGMTLRVLAERISEQPGITITSAAISDWERGVSTPRPHLQVALCKALEVPWSTIFDLDSEVMR